MQPEGVEKPENIPSDPQQEEHPDTAEGKVIACFNLNVNYEGSEPKNETVAQEENEEHSDAEYEKMEIHHAGTFCQRMMHHNVCS